MSKSDRLSIDLAGIMLDNPIMSASGTYGSGKEYNDFLDISKLGAIVTKSVTLNPTLGNPPPRVVETPAGMLNAIGLQNEGVEYFVKELLPELKKKVDKVIVNVAGKTEREYIEVVERLSETDIDALEINISCPNVKEGGIAFGVCSDSAADLTRNLRKSTKKKLFVKLSPNVTDITEIAQKVENAGADALVVANTFIGMMVDIERRKPILANITGGLSGPCVLPLVLRLVWAVNKVVKCPIIAVGGISEVENVLAYLMAGATAVQVGTINFVQPNIAQVLIDDLDKWLIKNNTTVQEIINTLTY